MITLTFGIIPSAEWLARSMAEAFEEDGTGDPESYNMKLKGTDARVAEKAFWAMRLEASPAGVDLSAEELHRFLLALEAQEDDDAMSLASSILFTLGMEWV